MVLTIVASKAISVTVVTQDGTAGTARLIIIYQVQDYLETPLHRFTDARDYTTISTTITISSSITTLLTIPITNDVALETNQEFTVQLSGDALFSNYIATVTIIDDDSMSPTLHRRGGGGTLQTSVCCEDTVLIPCRD